MPADTTLRLVLIGWGAIAQTTAELLRGSRVQIVAIAVGDANSPRHDLPQSARLIDDPNELSLIRPDVVAEAAGKDSLATWGHASLEAGADLIVSSASAFADAALFESMRDLAAGQGVQIQIQPGALAGVEALVAASLMGVDTVEHRMVKPPLAWLGTPAETLCDLHNLTEPEAFYRASAARTAITFPKNANVAMTTALAGIGPDATMITLVADPTATTNRHELRAAGAFGTLEVMTDNNPLPDNPKTSALAAFSLVRAIQNRVTPIVL